MNQTCYALRSRDDNPYFFYVWFGSQVERLVTAAHGSVFDTITTATFQRFEALIPPDDLRTAFNVEVTPLFERVLAALRESRILTAARDVLLPKLLSGEIRVKDAEKLVERAV